MMRKVLVRKHLRLGRPISSHCRLVGISARGKYKVTAKQVVAEQKEIFDKNDIKVKIHKENPASPLRVNAVSVPSGKRKYYVVDAEENSEEEGYTKGRLTDLVRLVKGLSGEKKKKGAFL